MHHSLTGTREMLSCSGCQAMLHCSVVLGPWNSGTGLGSLVQKTWQQAIHKSDMNIVKTVGAAAAPELVMTTVMSWWSGRVAEDPAVPSGIDWGRGHTAFVLRKAPSQGSEAAANWIGLIAAAVVAPPGMKVAVDLTLGMSSQLFASG